MHIKTLEYNIEIDGKVIPKIAIYNQNKIPTGVVQKCIEHDTYSRYHITMLKDQYVSIFLDDGEFNPSEEMPIQEQRQVEPLVDQESNEDKEEKKHDENQISND